MTGSTKCDHGITFDAAEADKILGNWVPKTDIDFVMGNPGVVEIRKHWPRLDEPCPLGCGYNGIAYANMTHYIAGDW